MPEPGGTGWLRRLVTRETASDIFDPAWHDLERAHADRLTRARSRLERSASHARLLAATTALVIDCWRVGGARRTPHSSRPELLLMTWYYVKHALRLLVRDRAFTVGAALTLALGVGANVAVFAVVDAVLLRPLPYPGADALAILKHEDLETHRTKNFIAIGDYVDLAERQTSFEIMGAYGMQAGTVFDQGDPFRVSVLVATEGVPNMLGLRPVLGRLLQASDCRPGAAPVAVLGFDFWRQRFGSDPRVVGRSLRLESGFARSGISRTNDVQIVGVGTQGFRFPPDAVTDLVLPVTIPLAAPAQRKSEWTFALARLKPGTSIGAAAANLTDLSREMAVEHPASNQGSQYFPVTLRDELVGSSRLALELLLAVVSVVLLIACANVANLLLARSVARRREMAVRLALGADRRHLVSQLLAESAVLAALAGLVGVAVAVWGAQALVALVPKSVAVRGLNDLHFDPTVLAFALGIVAVTALAFAIVSAATVRSETPSGALVVTRVTMSRAARRATSGLVVGELALAIVLLIGAGLVVRSMMRLGAVDPGFQVDHLLTFTASMPADRYRAVGAKQTVYARALASIGALPDVRAVGDAAVVPLTGNNWTIPFERADQRAPAGQRPPDVGWQVASGGYFSALHIPLLAGRLFDGRDTPTTAAVVIISQEIARKFFPGEPAVGRHIVLGKDTAEIVGVVGDIRRAALSDAPRADLYFSSEQSPAVATSWFVKTTNDPARSLGAVQAAFRAIEPGVVFAEVRTMADVAGASMEVLRFTVWLFGVFAAVALALAAVGVYGVMSYITRQRTREIGTRTALGATGRDVVWLVMRQGGGIAALGVVVGLGVGVAAARMAPLGGLLYATSPFDPATFILAPATLVVATLLACYFPARRAARIDPARTLAES
jgi:putative ABC transport system permease protein